MLAIWVQTLNSGGTALLGGRGTEVARIRSIPATREPVSIMGRREEFRTLVDHWETMTKQTRRALVASVFESIRPTASGGLTAEVRTGWTQHVDAAAAATCKVLCLVRRRRSRTDGRR
jgi:hypothetical protein